MTGLTVMAILDMLNSLGAYLAGRLDLIAGIIIGAVLLATIQWGTKKAVQKMFFKKTPEGVIARDWKSITIAVLLSLLVALVLLELGGWI